MVNFELNLAATQQKFFFTDTHQSLEALSACNRIEDAGALPRMTTYLLSWPRFFCRRSRFK
jgi:hypothetical protein